MSQTKSIRTLLGLGTVMFALTFWMWPYLPTQDGDWFFQFADRREFLGIPNTLDVLSNLGFLAVGTYGLTVLHKYRSHPLHIYVVLLSLITLATAAGSAYFHMYADPAHLPPDRLPMSWGFATIVGMLVSDRVDRKLGLWVTGALIPLASLTVIGMAYDLFSMRPYIIVQFGSLIFAGLAAVLQPRGLVSNKTVFSAMGLYAAAKGLELLDKPIFGWFGEWISGHSLKHLCAALAVYRLIQFVKGDQK